MLIVLVEVNQFFCYTIPSLPHRESLFDVLPFMMYHLARSKQPLYLQPKIIAEITRLIRNRFSFEVWGVSPLASLKVIACVFTSHSYTHLFCLFLQPLKKNFFFFEVANLPKKPVYQSETFLFLALYFIKFSFSLFFFWLCITTTSVSQQLPCTKKDIL